MKLFSERFRQTFFVRSWAFWKVPLIWYTRPSVLKLDDERCLIRIPFRRRNRNHLGSMYFGVLCVGADVAGGLIAMHRIRKSGERVSLVFKDFKANFLKRPEGDVVFTCEDGVRIGELLDRVVRSGEREHDTVRVTATVPELSGSEPVAEFELTLSLKRRASSTPA
ncbi:MAG: PaaI family thioesterase [Thermoanaerobaculia bacterium]